MTEEEQLQLALQESLSTPHSPNAKEKEKNNKRKHTAIGLLDSKDADQQSGINGEKLRKIERKTEKDTRMKGEKQESNSIEKEKKEKQVQKTERRGGKRKNKEKSNLKGDKKLVSQSEETTSEKDFQQQKEEEEEVKKHNPVGESATKEENEENPNATDCSLQVRLPNGTNLKTNFRSNHKLRRVQELVLNELNKMREAGVLSSSSSSSSSSFRLVSPFPRREYEDGSLELTLAEAELVPRAVLVVELVSK